MENKGARFLAFDSLKGLKEAIEEVDTLTTKKKYPHLSLEERSRMDTVIYTSYFRKYRVTIGYIHHGREKRISDFIEKLDAVRHRIIMASGEIIYLAEIISLDYLDDSGI